MRRRGSQPPPELEEGSPQGNLVDWRASVALNLVLQSTFLLSVAACG